MLKTAYNHVNSEMNVFLPLRVFLEVQESIGVIRVVLSVYSAKSRFRVSRMLVDPGLSALMINGLQEPSREEAQRVGRSYTAAHKHQAFLPLHYSHGQ